MQFRRNLTAFFRACSGKRRLNDAASRAIFIALLALLLSASPTRAATLHYDAYLSGLPIGSAIVEIERTEHAYRVSGTASSQGVAHLFSDWHSDFLAAGRLHNGDPILTDYAYDEREKAKHRVLWLSEGTVRHVKNDQVRPSHPVRTGTDILTAFFIQPDCWADRQLHTGRYSYRVTGRPSRQAAGCHFEVTDSDGDRTRIHVLFGQHEGRRIPIEVRSKGLIRGRITLRPVSEQAAGMLLAERP